ncbi:hypothetical protein [Acidiphilium sp.]|uniref:hypothetical protein n=1 Tax=Acidiphilium sp. TaxID=527 RepID=UPI003D04927C
MTRTNRMLLGATLAFGITGATAFAAPPPVAGAVVSQRPLNVVGQYAPGVSAPSRVYNGQGAAGNANNQVGSAQGALVHNQFASTVGGQNYPRFNPATDRTAAVQAVSGWHPDQAPTPQVANGTDSLQFPMGN